MLETLHGTSAFLIGIKGTGMSALADLLVSNGASVGGWDTEEEFYTQYRLQQLNIPMTHHFDPETCSILFDYVIHSDAYTAQSNPYIAGFKQEGETLYSYPQFLGLISQSVPTVAIAGVHGKTTTSGMAATIAQALKLPISALCGGQINSLNDRAVYSGGTERFLVEACEYRNNYHHIRPIALIITNIESDHQDFFKTYDDIYQSFYRYATMLPPNGHLICSADNDGTNQLAKQIATERPDIHITRYGTAPHADIRIADQHYDNGTQHAILNHAPNHPITLSIPGRHNIANATAAILANLYLRYSLDMDDCSAENIAHSTGSPLAQWLQQLAETPSGSDLLHTITDALASYSGARRRMELIASANDITIYDDYAHHPTSIRAALAGIREFYPTARIVASFMPHTYSRTAALLDDFATAFADADLLYTHDIYASARETNTHGIDGASFAQALRQHHTAIHYMQSFEETVADYLNNRQPGDIFITLGAGNNWEIGRAIAGALSN